MCNVRHSCSMDRGDDRKCMAVQRHTCTCVWGARSPQQSTAPPAGCRVPRSHLRCRAPRIAQRAAPSEEATGRTVIGRCAACAAGGLGPCALAASACTAHVLFLYPTQACKPRRNKQQPHENRNTSLREPEQDQKQFSYLYRHAGSYLYFLVI